MRILLLVIFFLLLYPTPIYAVSLAITDSPKEVKLNNEFTVKFSLTGAKAAINYFKIHISKDNSKASFSETWNGNNWYSGSNGKEYLQQNVSSNFTGEIKGRIIEQIDPGNYKLSVKRYTASGSVASDDGSPVDLTLIVDQTPQPTSVPTPIPTVKSTPNPVQTNFPEAKVLSTQEKIEVIGTDKPMENQQNQLTEDTAQEPKTSPTPAVDKGATQNLNFAIPLGVTGGGLISFGGFTLWKEYKRWYTEKQP